MKENPPIPILMYHSVGRPIPGWKSPWFSLPARIFADHVERLARAGYRSVTLDEVREYVVGERSLPQRSVAITFDDGYIDTWTYAVPILRKFGFRGAVFITPEFVDPRDVVRPTLDNVGFKSMGGESLEVRGFMSWGELKRASDEKVLSVEAHGLTHTFYPINPEVIDFHHPGDSYLWLDWNAYPDEKPFYIERLGANRVAWGTPVYRHGKSLTVRRYFPDPRESEHLAEYVRDQGGEAFFRREGWRETLMSEILRLRKTRPAKDRYESPDERLSRYEDEILGSRRRIEERTGRRPGYFVFPGGGYDDDSFGLALSFYKSVPIRSPENESIRNQPGEDPRFLSRRGTQVVASAGRAVYTDGEYLVEYLREYQGDGAARKRRQLRKLLYLMGLRLGFCGNPLDSTTYLG
jgi:peptidoglycan/xylan/chitin deacetylase (PgdA/CDA1 family)